MKKVLILAYYFPPDQGIASHRPYSWAKYFSRFGLKPTVVCRHWESVSQGWEDFNKPTSVNEIQKTEYETYTCYRIPFRKSMHTAIQKCLSFFPLLSRIYSFIIMSLGICKAVAVSFDAYYKFLSQHLERTSYDIIIVAYPPQELMRVGYKLYSRFRIPWLLDYRDGFGMNQHLIRSTASFPEKITQRIYSFYEKKWTRTALASTCVSEPIAENTSRLIGKKIYIVYNGYDHEDFFDIGKSSERNQKFTINHVGTLYERQDCEIFLEGLKNLNEDIRKSVQINFVGGAVVKGFEKRIELWKKFLNINVTPVIPRKEVFQCYHTADALYLCGYIPEIKGYYTGKVFEYLASRKPILFAPGDQDILDSLIQRTNAGKICYTADDVAKVILAWYNEWKNTGGISFSPNVNEIEKYSRLRQAGALAKIIHSVLSGEK